MCRLRVHTPDEDGVDERRQPYRPERERALPRKHDPQRRIERHCKQRRHDDREHCRVRQRLEQPALLRLEGQHGEEGDGDHEQREEACGRHLSDGADDDRLAGAVAAAALPFVQLLVRLLHDNDRPVHQNADGDGNAAERHDVRGDPHQAEESERDEHGERDGEDRDECAGNVPEEKQHDQRHRGHDLEEGGCERADGAPDQVGAVVDAYHLHAGRQPGRDFLEPRLDAFDHVERVLALAHDDDARDDVALPVEVGDAAPLFRADHDLADVLDADRRAVAGRGKEDVLEVADRFRVAAAPDHVFRPADLDHAATDFAIAPADGIHHPIQRDAVEPQPVRVDADLILAAEATDRRDLGDAGYGSEVSSQVLILDRAEVGERLRSALVHEDVLVDPSQARGVGPELRRHTFGKGRRHRRQVLQRPRPRPVDVGVVLEYDLDVGVAEVRDAADRRHPRRAKHGADNRGRHLIFDHVRAAVPPREDDHLRVAEVRDGVQRQLPH